jgi:predicted NBD/HSP70 family sugar kinase
MTNSRSGVVGSVDLGGTKLLAALADMSGHIIAEDVVPTDRRGGTRVVEQVQETLGRLADSADIPPSAMRSAAVGVPGAVDLATGQVTHSPNLHGLDAVDVRAELETALGVHVVLDNDVNMAVRGEHSFGHGAGRSDFVFVAVGTGIGMGILAGGALLRGATGAAGEIAYLPVGADPFGPDSPLRGTLESVVAGATISRRYASRTGRVLSVPEIFDTDDADARAVLDEEARDVALGIAAVSAVLDPGLVVLGGGIGSRTEFLPPVSTWLTRVMARPPRVETSRFGHRAALVGAVVCAIGASDTPSRVANRRAPFSSAR